MNNSDAKPVGAIALAATNENNYRDKANVTPVTPVTPRKYNDAPLYQSNKDHRSELGYSAPGDNKKQPPLPRVEEVRAKIKITSPNESPLKEWWKKEQMKNERK